MVAHHRIDIAAAEFLARFKTWVPGPHDGSLELVQSTRASGVTIACLSNTNEAHWSADNGLAQFTEQFDRSFLSFEIGHVKPERGAFEYVVTELNCEPAEILFLDDVQLNVDTACEFGIDAVSAGGVDAARAILSARSLLRERF